MPLPTPSIVRALAALGAVALALTACAPSQASGGAGDGTVRVLASFYPLQFVAEQVGGDLVEVSSLTPPGAEPHDVELSPRQVRAVSDTDLVVYLSGFQPAVDQAVEARQPPRVLDAAEVVDLVQGAEHAHAEDGGTGAHAEDGHAEDDHAADAHAEDAHAGDDHAADDHAAEGHAEEEGDELDPHFWLDPRRLAALAGPVADALAEADPEHADAFADGAARLAGELDRLDAAFADGLADCERRVVVTSHRAFGYLTGAYGLEQVGISGLDPEAEPSPARLREIGEVVRAEGVTTLFTESLVNPKVAETLAADLGVTTAMLDPVESQTDSGADYRAVMEQNLEALRAALGCS